MLYLIVEVADNVLWHLLFIFITIFTTVILTEITFENIQKVRFIVACVGKIFLQSTRFTPSYILS